MSVREVGEDFVLFVLTQAELYRFSSTHMLRLCSGALVEFPGRVGRLPRWLSVVEIWPRSWGFSPGVWERFSGRKRDNDTQYSCL